MAVSKLWKVTERLGQVIDYATNPENKVLATVTPDAILKDDYIHTIKKVGLREYLPCEISEEAVGERQTDDPNTTPIGDEDYYFHRPGMGEFEAIYYNPDSNAGGQFVVLHIPYGLITEAKSNSVVWDLTQAAKEDIDELVKEIQSFCEVYSSLIENLRKREIKKISSKIDNT